MGKTPPDSCDGDINLSPLQTPESPRVNVEVTIVPDPRPVTRGPLPLYGSHVQGSRLTYDYVLRVYGETRYSPRDLDLSEVLEANFRALHNKKSRVAGRVEPAWYGDNTGAFGTTAPSG